MGGKIQLKSKKNIIFAIMVIFLAVIIPTSIYAYNAYNYNNQYNKANKYLEEEKFDEAISTYKNSLKYKGTEAKDIDNKIAFVNELKQSKLKFQDAVTNLEQKKYIEAIDIFKKVSKKDVKRYKLAQDKIKESKSVYINDNISKAKTEAGNKKFDVAVSFLDIVLKFEPAYQEALTLKEQYNKEIERIKEEDARKEAEAKLAAEAAKKKTPTTAQPITGPSIPPAPKPTTDPNAKFLVGAKLLFKTSNYSWLTITAGSAPGFNEFSNPPTWDLEIYLKDSQILIYSKNCSIINYFPSSYYITVTSQETGQVIYRYTP